MHLYQIAVLTVALFMIYEGTHDYFHRHTGQTFFKYLVRLAVWGGMAAIAVFPNISTLLATIIGIEGNINAVILIGFLLVFLLVFKLLSAIEHIEQNITELTREKALKKINPDETK